MNNINIERPQLDHLDPDVRAYIEGLESELERLRQAQSQSRSRRRQKSTEESMEPSEPPTTINLVTVSAAGVAKRTPRHLYSRQRRGGMGVFDLETPEEDPPAFLAIADESDHLILITDQGRAFRMPLQDVPQEPVYSRGQSITEHLSLNEGERLAVLLPDRQDVYVALLTRRGHVRWFAGHLLGENLRAGTILYDVAKFGTPSAACWSQGNDDLFITSQQGKSIRFAARQVPVSGCLGIRLSKDDVAIAITSVRQDSGVFLLSENGKGTIRLMSGFRAHKSPGGGGKIGIKTDRLAGAQAVNVSENQGHDDIFSVSHLGKIIRFSASQVPPKKGVVQGVNCMSLRADRVVAMAVSPAPVLD